MKIKYFFLFAAVSLSLSTLGFSASNTQKNPTEKLILSCSGTSDPDHADVDIYAKKNGRLIASVYVETGDGDNGGTDVIEVVRKHDGNDSQLTYVQLDDKRPRLSAVKHPTRKTKGAVIRLQIPLDDQETDGVFTAESGPTGESFDETAGALSCKAVK